MASMFPHRREKFRLASRHGRTAAHNGRISTGADAASIELHSAAPLVAAGGSIS
jgi:hypothetical protein